MRLAVVLALAGGCGFEHGLLDKTPGDAAPGSDADASSSTNDARDGGGTTCTDHVLPPAINVNPAQWSASFLTAPTWTCSGATNKITVDATGGSIATVGCAADGSTITNNIAQTTNGASSVLVIRLRGLTITNGAALRLTGNKPVIIFVAGNVVVDNGGLIDAGAKLAEPGPGGSLASVCTNLATGRGDPSNSGGYGGGGGGFGTAGGQGGYNNVNGGSAQANLLLVPLRGGCSGGSSSSSNTGVGGGGGAIEISATGTISVGASAAAAISVGGGGGPAATAASAVGGHGGGSGGGILLVAPTLATIGAQGALRAHGGSGSSGCGSSCNAGSTMNPGRDGHSGDETPATDTSGIAGSSNNDHGRQGGLFSLVSTQATAAPGELQAAQMNGGRGGGGGGGGAIVLTTGSTTMACD